ncbi:NAD-dependent epimerase/dehydratase family protein [Streptomyces sp. SID4919]|uniref:NAD-dependent epimerase/dehydratase family protein n=1 Tax=unclassified Streptomyces TaxID=2593676 RepID=UPI000823A7C1|nr:NAD-dependent epimerase/dehydratase family protein [Streptomyces sp. AmelKG-E11A]MYY07923.1 NAD-dependent epimerase/dehydratase family protein [Streptomyces sp. SID4919]SCK07054.1 Nucleoside-diphosphate-sugar epimerase [Streptomyces sp. AmelKG-E11A]
MRKKILITGGAGFIGLHLARRLADDCDVTLLDDFSRGRSDAQLSELLGRVTLVEHDLTTPVPPGLLADDYSEVYHLAAVVGVVHSNDDPRRVLRTNLLTTIHLLDWFAALSGATLCFASSSEAYAGSVEAGAAPVPTTEDVPLLMPDPTVSRSSYGFSKITGEVLCRTYARTHGFALRMVRFHNVYGPRMGYDHVIPQFIERLLSGADPFEIHGADQTRAFCYVTDAVEAIVALTALPTKETLLVNVGNDEEEVVIEDLARHTFDTVGRHPELDIRSAPPLSPQRRLPDLTRLRELTGYRPAVDLREGLRRTHAWYAEDLAARGTGA